jgi:CTD small phosphatase-like protein 2
VFTAAEKTYADLILDVIDPEKKWIKHRLYRDHCFRSEEGVYVKDLRIVSDRDIEDVVLVDNCMLSFSHQLENGIPICAYVGNNPDDSELLYLITYLDEAFHQDDIRDANAKTFKLKSI